MRVQYDQVQDLTLTLSEEEKTLLTERKTRDFYDNPLRGVSLELGAYVFLAYSTDEFNFLESADSLDNGLGKIVIPNADGEEYPWLINLSDEGIQFLRGRWLHGIRYNGSNKLFIRVTD